MSFQNYWVTGILVYSYWMKQVLTYRQLDLMKKQIKMKESSTNLDLKKSIWLIGSTQLSFQQIWV